MIPKKNSHSVQILPLNKLSVLDNLKDIVSNWNIAWSLALRDIQIRYKQSVVGVSWAMFQPLVTTLIFTLVFGIFVKIPTGETPYPVFVLSGLLFWQYFSKVVIESSGALVKNESIITKVYFPRIILPLVPVLSGAIDLLISLVILLALMFYYDMNLSINTFILPVLIVFTGLFGYGIGLMLAPINAIYRDIGIALPFFVQIGMYLTPVIYPVGFVPDKYQWIFLFNPVATLLDSARAIILGASFPSDEAFYVFFGWLSLVFILGFYSFRKLEPMVVDRI